MKTTVTVSNVGSGNGWFPEIGEFVLYKTPTMARAKIAERVDVKAGSKHRFAFVQGGNTCVGSTSQINKAISDGRMKPYVGTVTISQRD